MRRDLLAKLAKLPARDRQDILRALTPAQVEALYTGLCRDSFAEFVRAAWHLAGTTEPLVWGWHLDALCVHLEAVERGEIARLVINIPPGHAKSKIVEVLFPAWCWARRPETQFICASHAAALAERDSVYCRQLIESDWYRRRFMSDWRIKPDQNAKGFWANTREGHRYATGIGGTGRRGDIVLIDDPIEAINAYSKAHRDLANRWIGQTLPTRFNDAKTGRIVLIMQRLHDEDCAGFVLGGQGWVHLRLPSEYEPQSPCVTHRLVERDGERVSEELWRDPRTEENELLFPAKFPREVLDQLKQPNALGIEGFSSQHQQRPSPAGGLMFKLEWWRWWKPDGVAPADRGPRPRGAYEGPARALPDAFDQIIVSVDANFKAKTTADPVSILVIGALGADRFILERQSGPFGFTRTCEALEDIDRRWRSRSIRAVLIETKANGDAIVETLQSKISGVLGVNPEGGKEARAWAIQPQVQASNVYLPDGAPWADEFTAQHAAFPRGRHDDDVDALSQGLRYLSQPETSADFYMRLNR